MYAIVDIETTGGYASNNDITEVAIVLHDGNRIEGRFESLVKPAREIPYYIQVLTGITPEMVASAPSLEEVAPRIMEMLEGRIFVAHNVNFDYSFLKHHFSELGFDFQIKKLCTVRLAKKVFPGLSSYSLGNLCRHFQIPIEKRHRAGGDADATALLFNKMLENNALKHIEEFLRKSSGEQNLPPGLPREEVDRLPYTPGVYYFHDQKDKIVYVGKAKNLKYRVKSHFTHNGSGRQRQDFLRNVVRITYQSCSTELMAFILENVEIRRLWPEFNYSQKRFQAAYGLYSFEDQQGYRRLAIEKKRPHLPAYYTFSYLSEGYRLMNILKERFSLCPRLCHIQKGYGSCVGLADGTCLGACEQKESVEAYNQRVEEALYALQHELPSFALFEDGDSPGEKACYLVEKGRFFGMGTLPEDEIVSDLAFLKTRLTAYPESDYIRGLLYTFAEKRPDKKIILSYE